MSMELTKKQKRKDAIDTLIHFLEVCAVALFCLLTWMLVAIGVS